jgi:type II secretory pathway pseudopilin PulG
MDKALEIIMVAVILIIASVVIITLLQGQSGDFGEFSDNRTQAGNCGFGELKYQRAIDKDACTEPDAADEIESNYDGCSWTDNSLPDAYC